LLGIFEKGEKVKVLMAKKPKLRVQHENTLYEQKQECKSFNEA
jgi:hypothetical protein